MSTSHAEKTSDHAGNDVRRLHTHELEVRVTDAVRRHVQRHVIPLKPVSQRKLDFEHARPRWMREMAAEAIGVFFYVYPGIASTASFILNNIEPAFGSLFQIGCAYALGIAFAIIVCGPTSGGHFHPAITICSAVWQGFPWSKVPRYILAQVFGSFLAGMVLVGVYHPQLSALEAKFVAAGLPPNSLGGPGSILTSFPGPTQTNYGYLFAIEFFVCTFIASIVTDKIGTGRTNSSQGIVIWAVLDPANPFISLSTAPFIIGFAYADMIWGFGGVTIATNTARDLGTRIVAAIFYGGDAFSRYSAISILVNIPATLFATAVYEFILKDSFASIAKGHNIHEDGKEGLTRHLTKVGTLDQGMSNAAGQSTDDSYQKGKHSSPV